MISFQKLLSKKNIYRKLIFVILIIISLYFVYKIFIKKIIEKFDQNNKSIVNLVKTSNPNKCLTFIAPDKFKFDKCILNSNKQKFTFNEITNTIKNNSKNAYIYMDSNKNIMWSNDASKGIQFDITSNNILMDKNNNYLCAGIPTNSGKRKFSNDCTNLDGTITVKNI